MYLHLSSHSLVFSLPLCVVTINFQSCGSAFPLTNFWHIVESMSSSRDVLGSPSSNRNSFTWIGYFSFILSNNWVKIVWRLLVGSFSNAGRWRSKSFASFRRLAAKSLLVLDEGILHSRQVLSADSLNFWISCRPASVLPTPLRPTNRYQEENDQTSSKILSLPSNFLFIYTFCSQKYCNNIRQSIIENNIIIECDKINWYDKRNLDRLCVVVISAAISKHQALFFICHYSDWKKLPQTFPNGKKNKPVSTIRKGILGVSAALPTVISRYRFSNLSPLTKYWGLIALRISFIFSPAIAWAIK